MWGLDFLGIAKFKDVALAEFPEGFALGAFSITFGDAVPAVEAIVNSGRCPRVRLHLSWKDDHKFNISDFANIEREARRIKPLIERHPNFDWRVSGACEHTLKRADAI